MAGLIGVPAAVHMGQVESPDSAHRAPDREEVADGGGAPYLDDEDVRAAGNRIAQVPGLPHAPLEKGQIDRLGRERTVGREIRKMDDERSEEHTSELQSLMRIQYAVL